MTITEKGRRLIHARSPGKEARTKEKVEVGAAVDRAAEAVEKDHDLTGAEEYPPHPEGRKTRLEQSERLLTYLPTIPGGQTTVSCKHARKGDCTKLHIRNFANSSSHNHHVSSALDHESMVLQEEFVHCSELY